jgi:hypothetical protein
VANSYGQSWKTGEYVGDIDSFKVIKKDHIYSLWDNDVMVSFVSTSSEMSDTVTVDYWVDKKYRGQKIISKFLWFLKTREGMSKIIIGKQHSGDTVQMLRSGGLSHFKKSWVNIKSGERVPYDKEKDNGPGGTYEPYRSMAPTDWRIILENSGDFSDYPRFNKDADVVDIRMMYEGFAD